MWMPPRFCYLCTLEGWSLWITLHLGPLESHLGYLRSNGSEFRKQRLKAVPGSKCWNLKDDQGPCFKIDFFPQGLALLFFFWEWSYDDIVNAFRVIFPSSWRIAQGFHSFVLIPLSNVVLATSFVVFLVRTFSLGTTWPGWDFSKSWSSASLYIINSVFNLILFFYFLL